MPKRPMVLAILCLLLNGLGIMAKEYRLDLQLPTVSHVAKLATCKANNWTKFTVYDPLTGRIYAEAEYNRLPIGTVVEVPDDLLRSILKPQNIQSVMTASTAKTSSSVKVQNPIALPKSVAKKQKVGFSSPLSMSSGSPIFESPTNNLYWTQDVKFLKVALYLNLLLLVFIPTVIICSYLARNWIWEPILFCSRCPLGIVRKQVWFGLSESIKHQV